MNAVAVLVGALLAALGAAGFANPRGLLETVQSFFQTPTALWVVAVVRIAVGIVLVASAQRSRAPRTLRILGAVILVAGLITPFFGVERARAIMDWYLAHGPGLMRAVFALLFGLGLFVIYAARARHDAY
jgi:hypothetical protein